MIRSKDQGAARVRRTVATRDNYPPHPPAIDNPSSIEQHPSINNPSASVTNGTSKEITARVGLVVELARVPAAVLLGEVALREVLREVLGLETVGVAGDHLETGVETGLETVSTGLFQSDLQREEWRIIPALFGKRIRELIINSEVVREDLLNPREIFWEEALQALLERRQPDRRGGRVVRVNGGMGMVREGVGRY